MVGTRVGVRTRVGVLTRMIAVGGGGYVHVGAWVGKGVAVGGAVGSLTVGTTMVSFAEDVDHGTGVSRPVSTVANRACTSVAAGSSSNITSPITLTSTTGIPGVSGSME